MAAYAPEKGSTAVHMQTMLNGLRKHCKKKREKKRESL